MHALHRKAQVLLYLIVLFVFHFFLRAVFSFFFPVPVHSSFLPLGEEGGQDGGGGRGVCGTSFKQPIQDDQ